MRPQEALPGRDLVPVTSASGFRDLPGPSGAPRAALVSFQGESQGLEKWLEGSEALPMHCVG